MTADGFRKEWDDGNPFVVGHTSGSTGIPKEIRLSKEDMRVSASITNRFFGIDAGSRLLLCLSPDYIAGKMMIVRALVSGAELAEEKPSNRPLEHYDGLPFDLAAVVPSQALWLAEHPERLRFVRKLIVGGGEISPRLRRLLSGLPVEAYATYGMTETCSHVALARITPEGKPFRALPPVKFSTDSRGCLVIEAPQFSFRRLVTNDVVELLSPETFYWKGRYDNVINTGGIKVFPEEIERKIASCVNGRFYITSRPSEKWGREVVLKIEGADSGAEASEALLVRLRGVLSAFECPKAVVFERKFRETASGKIKRSEL